MVQSISRAGAFRSIGPETVRGEMLLSNPLPPFVAEADSSLKPLTAVSRDEKDEVQARFQEFMAGTFYSQMVKSLRAGQGKPAYFHGGQAEEIFQSQLDQIVSSNLAKSHGAAISQPLFESYLLQRGEKTGEETRSIDITI